MPDNIADKRKSVSSYLSLQPSYILHLTSYIFPLTSYLLHLTSYLLPLLITMQKKSEGLIRKVAAKYSCRICHICHETKKMPSDWATFLIVDE